jgi:1-acyl-sn-glycerol-3-phosphate acyltransferase
LNGSAQEEGTVPEPQAPTMHDAYRVRLPLAVAALCFLWRWLIFVPLVALITVAITPVMMVVSAISEDAAYRCAQAWAWAACLCNLTRVRVRGRENMPACGCVVMTNHQSAFDFSLIIAIPGQLRWIMKTEIRRVPFFAWAAGAAGTVWLDRSNRAAAVASLRAMRPSLERGVSLQIFPEGTRSRDGALLPFKKGGFMLALELGVPIVPVTISGSGRVWPPGTWRIIPGCIGYVIHPAIDVRAFGLERRDELMQAVRAAIESGLACTPSRGRGGGR